MKTRRAILVAVLAFVGIAVCIAAGWVLYLSGLHPDLRWSLRADQEKATAHAFCGCWHMFVPKEENGPHHEYYEIRTDGSVIARFLAVDGNLIARFPGRLEGNSIASENGKVRFSLRREGESLIIRDKKDFVFSRIESMPARCK